MQDNGNMPTSRRELLKLGAYGLGVAGAISLVGGPAEARVQEGHAGVSQISSGTEGGKELRHLRQFRGSVFLQDRGRHRR